MRFISFNLKTLACVTAMYAPGNDDDMGNAEHTGNFPVLTSVNATGSNTLTLGTLNSTPNGAFQIDFYDSLSTNAGPAGKTYLGSTFVNTDASGNANFYVSFASVIPANSYVTSKASDTFGNTSDFSAPRQFIPVNPVNVTLTVTVPANATMVGEQQSFILTLTNSSATDATGVTVNDLLPTGLGYAYSVATQGTATSSNNLTVWNVGTLTAGSSAAMTIYASAQSVGNLTNIATFSQNEFNLTAPDTNKFVVAISLPVPVAITSQPQSQLLNLSALLRLVVGITGSPNAKYQWRLNGANIPGATNATYSKASLLATDGGLYTVVVSDQFGATTSDGALISLGNLLALSASDSFSGIRLPILLGTASGNNLTATSEAGEPEHAGVPGGKSVWFTWTPLLSGVATISTAGSSFDTLLGVYTGSSINSLTEIASNDDDGGYYTSRATFNAVGGTTYQIAVDGAYGASGQIVVSASEDIALLTPPVPKITRQPTNQIVNFGDTASFSVQGSGSGLAYQWYYNDVAIPSATTASLLVKNVSVANVGRYTVSLTKSGATTMSRAAALQVSVLDGVVNPKAIALDKFQTAFNTILTGILPTRLNKANAAPASMSVSSASVSSSSGGTSRGYSSTQTFSTYGGATQTSEPNHCGSAGGNSAWTYIQAADTGVLTIDTDGSNFKTILAVYTGNGSDFSSLTSIACDIGSGQGGTNSKVVFAATSNTVYYVAIDNVNAGPGTVVLHANLTVPPAIVAQPLSQTAAPGTNITLNATATGYQAPKCQWWYNGAIIVGATNGTLTITNLQSSKCGTYQMTATNSLGVAATTPATLMLNSTLRMDTFSFDKAAHKCAMRLVGIANTTYIIQTSTNMLDWVPVATNTPATGFWTYNDNYATGPQRFYRAIPSH